MLAYTWGLGGMLRVARLDNLLPAIPEGQQAPQLISDDELSRAEQGLEPTLAESQATAGWHIFVEVALCIATQPLEPETGRLREATASFHELFKTVRQELKGMPPSGRRASDDVQTVEGVALRMLNTGVRLFLAKWHPRLADWEANNEEKPESDWPEASACRAELEQARLCVLEHTRQLGAILGLQDLDSILPPAAR